MASVISAEAVTWAAGFNPAAVSITIPSDCTAVYHLWAYFAGGDAQGMTSITLNSIASNQDFEIPTNTTGGLFEPATGVSAFYSPATGARNIDVFWDDSPSEGSVCFAVYVKDGDLTAWRDAQADQGDSSASVSVTLNTQPGDLVIKHDQKFGGTPPSLSSGWTNISTTTNNSESARVSYIVASGTTTVCASEDEDYSSIVAIAIPSTGGGAAAQPGQPWQQRGGQGVMVCM